MKSELGITAKQVSKIECGEVACSLDKLYVLKQIFEVSYDYLIDGESRMMQNH